MRVASSQLVDVSCEVGEGLCRDNLYLVRWVGARHRPVWESVREQKRGDVVGQGTGRIPLVDGAVRGAPVRWMQKVTS
jgi:hypothetical protein